MLSDPFASAFLAQCSACSGLLNRRDAVKCGQCGSAFYCSAACQREHWRLADNPALAHSAWCSRLRLFRQRAAQLAEHPFPFAATTTAEGFDSQSLSRFLLSRGLLGRGMWRRECYAWLAQLHPSLDDAADDLDEAPGAPLPGELAPEPEPYAMPAEAAILSEPLAEAPASLTNWAEYYQARRLPLDSPVCVLLQWPLTLYHLLFNLLPSDAPDAFKRLAGATADGKRPIVMHLIGAEKEVELIPALCELARLAPGYRFRLALVGKEVSPSVHNSVYSGPDGRICVSVHRGLYHKVAAGLLQPARDGASATGGGGTPEAAEDPSRLPQPDVIVALNAGFAASISWPATLDFLKRLSVRTYVTDYCEFSMELSAMVCDKLGAGTLTPQRLNPFRSPIRVPNEQLDQPSYSNAFVSELVYPA